MGIFSSEPMRGSLKNPNALREAFIYNAMSSKSSATIQKFVTSKEASIMVENGLISDDLLERLASDCEGKDCHMMNITVCHMAKENDDPMWDLLVQKRREEQELMNGLLAKYGQEAASKIDGYENEFIKRGIPSEFRDAE